MADRAKTGDRIERVWVKWQRGISIGDVKMDAGAHPRRFYRLCGGGDPTGIVINAGDATADCAGQQQRRSTRAASDVEYMLVGVEVQPGKEGTIVVCREPAHLPDIFPEDLATDRRPHFIGESAITCVIEIAALWHATLL